MDKVIELSVSLELKESEVAELQERLAQNVTKENQLNSKPSGTKKKELPQSLVEAELIL